MIKDLLRGFYFGIGFLLTLGIIFGIVWAVGFHTADEILGGTFNGNFDFNGNVSVNSVDITPAITQTIYFDNSMSADEIQTQIDSVGKYISPSEYVLFQFLPGTYILDHSLNFDGFYGGGKVLIEGNMTESNGNTLHTNQEVFLDFSGQESKGLSIIGNNIDLRVYNLHIKVKSDVENNVGIYLFKNGMPIYIAYSYLEGTGTTIGRGILTTTNSLVTTEDNYFSNIEMAIRCNHGSLDSDGNDDIGTIPKYGLSATVGCTIAKITGTQPSGSTAAEQRSFITLRPIFKI